MGINISLVVDLRGIVDGRPRTEVADLQDIHPSVSLFIEPLFL